MSRWNHALNVAKRASERVSQSQRCDRQGKTRAKQGAFPARACSQGSQLRDWRAYRAGPREQLASVRTTDIYQRLSAVADVVAPPDSMVALLTLPVAT